MLLFSGWRPSSWLCHVILISSGDRLRLTSWRTLDQDYAASPEPKNQECTTSKRWLVGRASSWNALSAQKRACSFSLSAFTRLRSPFGDYHPELSSVKGLREFIWRPCAHCGLWLALRSGPSFNEVIVIALLFPRSALKNILLRPCREGVWGC